MGLACQLALFISAFLHPREDLRRAGERFAEVWHQAMLSPARFLQGIRLSFGLRNARVAALTRACSQVMSGYKTWCLSATALTSEALKRLLHCTLYSYNATIYPGVQMALVSSQKNITDYCGITCNGLGFYPRGKEIPQVASIWVRLGLGPIESAMISYDKTNT